MKLPSLRGWLKARWLQLMLDRPPLTRAAAVPGTNLTVQFVVQTTFEYFNRAQGSYTGEPDMVAWLREVLRPGDVLWDVGANVGAYSILAAKLEPGARVIAFEPYIPTFAHLWDNIALNGVSSQVFPVNAGLLDETKADALAVGDPRAGSAQHQAGQAGGSLRQGLLIFRGEDIPERLGLPAPTLLKLDIDGLEAKAVAGLGRLLCRQDLREAMIEVEEGKSSAEVESLMMAAGLRRRPNPKAIPTGHVVNWRFSRQ